MSKLMAASSATFVPSRLNASFATLPNLSCGFTSCSASFTTRGDFVLKVKNFGVTPAYQVRACHGAYMTARDSFPPDDFPYNCGEFCETCPPITIGPGAETPIVLNLPRDEVLMASFGLKRMFNFGKITFNDTFSTARKHSFCWFFQGDNQGDAFGCPKNNTDEDE